MKKRRRLLIIFICFAVLIAVGFLLFITYSSQNRIESIKPTPNLPGEKLRSLPYASWKPIDEKEVDVAGVTKYYPELACNGVNLFFTDKHAGAYLFDMTGKILHGFIDKREEKLQWKLMEPYLNDDFLVLLENYGMFRMDWDSNIKWVRVVPFHHDIAVGDNGDIYSIANLKILLPAYCPNEPIYDNVLMIMTGQGEVKKGISFADMVARNKELFYAATHPLEREYCYDEDAWDVFHANTVEVIDRDVYDGDKKLFGKGDVLFCIRHLNIIGVINIEKKEIIWYWGLGELEYPHHPSLLDNGNILLFDNGSRRKYSRVIEMDPRSGEIVWEYKGVPPESFFSADRGSAQRLPNGNTLIADSAEGRIIEVTKNGDVVWEFYNPLIDKEENKRAMIYRMVRFTDPDRFPRLKRR